MRLWQPLSNYYPKQSAVFWHAKNNPHARQCLTNFNTGGQQTEAHTAVSLWAQT